MDDILTRIRKKNEERIVTLQIHTKNTFRGDDILGHLPAKDQDIFTVLSPDKSKLIKDGFKECNDSRNSFLESLGIDEMVEGTAIAVLTGKRKIKIHTLKKSWVKVLPYGS
ncbi:MAG: hypothetical protein CR971_01715 [candidate division SR1 bacterium]|nr:MAG: hypothetical protein CR971_01715 [candidate division SR1 bacterium]